MTNELTRSILWCAAFGLVIFVAFSAHAEQAMEQADNAVRELVSRVMEIDDARGRPFIIVDKLAARVFAFDGTGALVGETPVLLGAGQGDISAPGIGTMPLADIAPAQRITPAGRYEAHLGTNLAGHNILWVDYNDALSLHAVVTGNIAEHRLERLATPSILDNRISYGCINVPAHFYEDIVEPLFSSSDGIVYILPEFTATVVRLEQ